jgi:hypothetical protein
MPNEKPRPLGGTGASELALMARPGEDRGIAYQHVLKLH